MVSTLGTDLQVRFEIRLKNVLTTALTLLPQTFSANTLFWIWFNLAFLPLKPGHVFPSATRPQNFALLRHPTPILEHTATTLAMLRILCNFPRSGSCVSTACISARCGTDALRVL